MLFASQVVIPDKVPVFMWRVNRNLLFRCYGLSPDIHWDLNHICIYFLYGFNNLFPLGGTWTIILYRFIFCPWDKNSFLWHDVKN
ncbi:hypothetical protein ES703_80945 [subsurface metagenome]